MAPSHADVLRGSSRVPAPRDEPLKTSAWEATLRAEMRKISNVLRLVNAKRTFARTYKGTKDRAYKEIQDEIVLLLGQVKCFHLSGTESMI